MEKVESLKNIWLLPFFRGIASVVLGALLVFSPQITTIVLIQFLGIYWLVLGVVSIIEIFVGDTGIAKGWLLIRGILEIIAGLVILYQPLSSAVAIVVALVTFFGIWALVLGVVNIAQTFIGGGPASFLLGILDIVIGLAIFYSLTGAAIALPIVIGILAIVSGLSLIFYSFNLRSRLQ